MTTFVTLVVVVIVAAIIIAFLNRFYRKASRERALIRTGWGGERVMLDGGFLALPFLHRVEEIDMRTMHISVERKGGASLMTEDRLRLDLEVAFYLRVEPSVEGVATAAQALGARALTPRELSTLFGGRFVDAIQAIVASRTMDQLHEDRSSFVAAVAERLADGLAGNGLKLESVSLTALDQASFSALEENNVFNAVGMRRLAEIVATNKKKRAQIEADAEVSVRQTELDGLKRKLDIDREQQQAQIETSLAIEQLQADSSAETEQARQDAQRRTEQARIARERDTRTAEIARDRETRTAEIERDRELREREVAALLSAETAKIDSQVALARKRIEETGASAEAELAKKDVVAAEEAVRAERDRLGAEREMETALIRVRQETRASEERTKSDVETLIDQARAESEASVLRADARRAELTAEADGKAAIIAAENTLSEPVLAMKVDMHKVDRLPEIAERMMKPMEKIDSIRINQISGLGGTGGSGGGNAEGGSAINNAVDGVLNLAFQLPAMQKLGQSLGVNLDVGDDSPAAPAADQPVIDADDAPTDPPEK